MPSHYQVPRAGLPTPPEGNMYGYSYHNAGPMHYGQGMKKATYDSMPYPTPNVGLGYDHQSIHYGLPPMSAAGMHASAYGPISAPILPPPMADRSMMMHGHGIAQQHEQRPQQPAAKQEKITGGVSQTLDYEMDQMTDYVAEMAQKLVMPSSTISSAFRKFVSGLLSSTRLPSSTILLGLNYLARRMNMLNHPTPFKTTDSQVWHMLTVALLLGSKFLDDNTFQNRSWSEVSGIPVKDLNILEKDWLVGIDWNLHIDPLTDEDFQSWLKSWANYKEGKNKVRQATLDRLAPLAHIDTNVSRYQSSHKGYSPPVPYGYSHHEPLSAHAFRSQPSYEQQPAWGHDRSYHNMSPPSAPESGPTTPEYMMLPNSGLPPADWRGYDAFYNRRSQQSSAHVQYALPQSASYHHTPANGHYSQGIWGHQAGCGCGYCNHANDPYFMNSGYGQQTVVG